MSARPALRFARDLARRMPRPLAAASALSVAAAAGEGLGVLLLARLLLLLGAGEEAGGAGVLARAVDAAFAAVGAQATLGGVLLAFVGVAVLLTLLQRSATLVSQRMQQEAALAVRKRLYRAVAEARWLPLARLRGGELLAALTGEADRVGAAAAYLLGLLVRGLLALAYLALALRISPGITLLAAACGALLLAVLRGRRAAARRAGQEGTRAAEALSAAASEHLGALKVVKSYGAEARGVRRFEAAAGEAVEARLAAWRAYADAQAVISAGSVILLAALAYAALAVLGVPTPTVLLLVFLFYRLVPRLTQFQMVYQMLVHEIPAWERLEERIRALEAERETQGGAAEPVPLRESLRLEGVRFAYEPGREVVAGVTLEVPARRTTAIVGPSGAGKTTVVDLVMGLALPDAGAVTIDGRTLAPEWLHAWRAGVGYVAQDTVLFHDSVLANLRWARPEATEEEVWEALRLAAAGDFVRALPDGLHTLAGDRGVRLSGGERQRLALARALLRRPSLLILDEATSALDAENEQRVRAAVRGLHGSVTILLITHRLPSVRDADLIHVMEEGRLVESGSFGALMAREGGRFRRLWESQGGG